MSKGFERRLEGNQSDLADTDLAVEVPRKVQHRPTTEGGQMRLLLLSSYHGYAYKIIISKKYQAYSMCQCYHMLFKNNVSHWSKRINSKNLLHSERLAKEAALGNM